MRPLTIIATVVMSAVLSLGLWWFVGGRIPMFLLPLLLLLPLAPRPSKNRQQRWDRRGRVRRRLRRTTLLEAMDGAVEAAPDDHASPTNGYPLFASLGGSAASSEATG